jgi:hypothetical protein
MLFHHFLNHFSEANTVKENEIEMRMINGINDKVIVLV